VGYLCANFSLPRPLCSRLIIGPVYTTDRQTDVRQHHRLMPRLGGVDITSCRRVAATIYPRRRGLQRKRAAAALSQAGRAGPGPISQYAPCSRPAAHAARRPDVRNRRQTDRRQTASSLIMAPGRGHNKIQETQLSVTNRATHLRKCNGVVDLLKQPLPIFVTVCRIWSFCF